jgi:UDP-glucuronate 4-epimerase
VISSRCILLTGAAGFIGFHLARRLLTAGWRVVGVDSLNDYYDVTLKEARRDILLGFEGFRFVHGKVEEPGLLRALMAEERPDTVVHLAAQAGVRYSIENPRAYVEANLRWRIPMPISMACRLPCSGSSRFMAPGGGPTWRCSSSPATS